MPEIHINTYRNRRKERKDLHNNIVEAKKKKKKERCREGESETSHILEVI